MEDNVRRLKEVPFKELKVGDELISALGKHGVIARLDPNDDDWIEVVWEDGAESGGYHPQWSDKVFYVGHDIETT